MKARLHGGPCDGRIVSMEHRCMVEFPEYGPLGFSKALYAPRRGSTGEVVDYEFEGWNLSTWELVEESA